MHHLLSLAAGTLKTKPVYQEIRLQTSNMRGHMLSSVLTTKAYVLYT